MIFYNELNTNYVNNALDLVLGMYKAERKSIPYLPDGKFYTNMLREKITDVFKYGKGIMALDDGKLVGFLAGYEIEEFFGNEKGIYCPLFGNGIDKENYPNLYKELYHHAAALWVGHACLTHVITLFAGDEDMINEWFWMGFGLRCVDSIRQVNIIEGVNPLIRIKKLTKEEIPLLAQIHQEHNRYYRSSPLFMPNAEEDPVEDLMGWFNEENRHIWAAYVDEKIVGYMRVQPNAESFISKHPDVMNVTGAYVLSEERGKGIAKKLLSEIQNWLIENNYPLCGVDFEGFNPYGSSFWNKYFTPYTYSIVRRIDERILPFIK